MPLITPPLALYVHMPWCVRKCPYCDFNSYTLRDALPESRYVAALERDLAAQAAEVAGRPIVSIFFGGGTPSLFSPEAIGRVLAAARRNLRLDECEVTLEANPGTVERWRFADFRAAGINRVSLGAQSFDAHALQALGRIHDPGDTRRAVEELHAAGLTNFNLDLMYALPGQSVDDALGDVRAALELGPAHISHYQLTIEPGTVFAAAPPPLPSDDVAESMLTGCAELLGGAGFRRYEVSAHARPGRRCVHNLNYWTFGDYLGIGAGAHGKLTGPGGIIRTEQTRDPRRYMAASPGSVVRRPVRPAELPFEFMLNALRLPEGFDIDIFTARTGLAWSAIAAPVARLAARQLLGIRAGRCRPTERGLRFLNEALLEFLSSDGEKARSPVLSSLS